MTDRPAPRVPFFRLNALVETALLSNGYSRRAAASLARSIAACERDGTFSHGLLRLPGFIEAIRSGWADGATDPTVLSRRPSMITMDAGDGFIQVCLDEVRDELATKARETGCAILLVRNGHHFSALWPDIEGFADAGLVAFTCVNSRARLPAWDGRAAVFGTNAAAFACPRDAGRPIVWDQAASVISQGDVLLARRNGKPLPEGVALDARGEPTRDPDAALNGGSLLPYGGGKGASIAFMVEILAAGLSGGVFGFESPARGNLPSKCGQFLLLIDPDRSNAPLEGRVEGLVRAMSESGTERFPGSRRYARRADTEANGIPITAESLAELERLGGSAATQ